MIEFGEMIPREAATIRSSIESLEVEAIARRTGAVRRSARKLPVEDLLLALVALCAGTCLRLERLTSVVKLVLGLSYSKQALYKRLRCGLDRFLLAVCVELFSRQTMGAQTCTGAFAHFNRVLVHDSTAVGLPERFKTVFKGSGNQRVQTASLKIQLVMDLLNGAIGQVNLSGFTRNDQAAASDILDLAQPGDLVLRDLGYFVLDCFASMIERGIFFLSRYYHSIAVFDPDTGKQLDLARILRAQPCMDRTVLLGKRKRVPVRLIALPVPDAVANSRRRKARASRDKRHTPSPKRLFLMGWNILVTNVAPDRWTPTQALSVYRLRWRIEIIFKAWKSHLRLADLNVTSETMLRASIGAKLIFCTIMHRFHHSIEILSAPDKHASILRVANLLSDCAALLAAAILRIRPLELLALLIKSHAFYENRPDRPNFAEALEALC
jgi:hypothetical protein